MYQSELTPEMDKLNKIIQQSSSLVDLPSLETASTVNVNSFQSSSYESVHINCRLSKSSAASSC